MEQKRSEGVSIFAFIEIGLGLFGSLIFLFMIFVYIGSLVDKSGNPEVSIGIDIAKAFMEVLWPSFLIFFSGIGVLKLKPWARHTNVYIIPISLISVYIYRFFYWAGSFDIRNIREWHWPFSFLVPILIFIVFEIWFFTRPKVKEQFKPGGSNA